MALWQHTGYEGAVGGVHASLVLEPTECWAQQSAQQALGYECKYIY